MTDTGKECAPARYPLTHPQKRIWYIEQIYPHTSLHNIGGPIHIKGALDFGLLEAAINGFIKCHDGLRLHLIRENGEVKQYAAAYQAVPLDLVDFSHSPDPAGDFTTWVEQESQRVFHLYDSPLYHFTMFRISAADNGYLVRFHHLIADGWTINIMTEQICAAYEKLKQGQALPAIAAPSYLEYLELERQYLSSERFAKDRRFWNEKFSVMPEYLSGNPVEAINGRRKTYFLAESRSTAIKAFCNRYKISLNTFFTAAFLIYRLKTTGTTDMVLGIPVLNRSGQREKRMVGMFTSSMPFRITITGREDIGQFIRNVNQELLNCYFHQKYPYNLLAQDLELKKKGLDQLFDTCINYYNTKLNTELDGSRIENTEFYNGNQLYSLQLVIKDWSDSGNLTLDFDYRLDGYSELQIEKLYQSLNQIMDQLLAVSDMEIGRIQILSAPERQRLLYDFNATTTAYPGDKTIHQLFEAQVQKTPEKIAISFGNRFMTYGELNQKANQLARFLHSKGVGRESIVGLMATHSFEMVIGIMGVLKAGGAYLPIDPDNPATRTGYLLEDANARLLLTHCSPDEIQKLSFNGEILVLRQPEIYTGDDSNPPLSSGPNNLVYVIYTSGSTGQPKGVMIEHRGLVNYIDWAHKVYVRGEHEVFALYSSLAFDLTVTSIFTPLTGGHQIHITEDDGTEFILDKILREQKATIIKLTPAHLSLLQERAPGMEGRRRNSPVRCFIVGGEDFKTSLAANIQRSFGPQLAIYNEYGPTETVVGCMIHRYDPAKDRRNSVPIGVPADNVQVYLLDQYFEPVPPGVDGEMFISGDGVARGYLNQRELTGERFVENPFITGQKMYRTGDLARFLDDGRIEYRGRADFQVKIHGHRIELGEIEACLGNHPGIKELVVIDREDAVCVDRKDTGQIRNRGKYLCAYYVSPDDIAANSLRDYLGQSLPVYMIPQYFMRLPELPLTINGKVSRGLLPEPPLPKTDESRDPGYRNEQEAMLAGIVAEALSMNQVRVTDNFFQLGGDSIKAIQIAAKLKEQSFKLKVKDILTHPVIAEMAAQLERDTVLADQEPGVGLIEPTPIVAWFFHQKLKNPNHWNQSVLLNLAPQVNSATLNKILDTLIRHHDSLRINFNGAAGQLYYNPIFLTRSGSVTVFDVAQYSPAEQDEKIRTLGTELKSGLNLENGPLFKAALFECGSRGRKLLLTAHHLIIDGVSWRIILDDLANLINQSSRDQALTLPPKTVSYQKWAAGLVEYSRRQAQMVRTYWETVVNDDFQFPVDHNQGEELQESCATLREILTAAETEALLTTANLAYHTTSHELLMIALALTVSEWVREPKVLLEMEGHGREEVIGGIDLSRTVGWFTSIYPVRFEVNRGDLTTQIKSLKEQLRAIPNQGFDFGVLKYLTGTLPDRERKMIRFNYLGDFTATFRRGSLEPAVESSGLNTDPGNDLTALMEINVLMVQQELEIGITYSRNNFEDETVQKFSVAYVNRLRGILEHCRAKERVEFTPADFETVNLSQSDLDSLFA